MKVNVYLSGNNPEHDTVLTAFAEGLLMNNIIDPDNIKLLDDYEPSDIAVVFGKEKYYVADSKRRGNIISQQKELGRKTIIIEKGYINRDKYYSIGFNDINGHADFKNDKVDSSRADSLNIELKPWRKNQGKYLLLIGQVPWDASVQDSNHQQWIEDTVDDLQTMFNFPILFRAHPLAQDIIKPPVGVNISKGSLADDFEDAYAVVTFNSTTAVESIIEGIPTFTADKGSMAWDIGNIDMAFLDDPFCSDRSEWLNKLCYSQWNIEEMRVGSPWFHLMGESNE